LLAVNHDGRYQLQNRIRIGDLAMTARVAPRTRPLPGVAALVLLLAGCAQGALAPTVQASPGAGKTMDQVAPATNSQ
jgi:hypothetical protein